MNAIQPDTDLWEIWIEYDQLHPEYFGILYVHGEIPANEINSSSLSKIAADSEGQLCLQLSATSSTISYSPEVFYSEPIRNLNQYTSVCIYVGSELIGRFNDIEIII